MHLSVAGYIKSLKYSMPLQLVFILNIISSTQKALPVKRVQSTGGVGTDMFKFELVLGAARN